MTDDSFKVLFSGTGGIYMEAVTLFCEYTLIRRLRNFKNSFKSPNKLTKLPTKLL